MADSNVQLAADGSGKKMDTRTESTNSEHRQVMVIGDPATNAGVASVDVTKGLAVDLTNTGSNTNPLATSHTDTAPTTQNITAVDAATTTTAQQNSQSAFTGTPTAGSAASFTISGLATIDLQVTGVWVGTLATEVSFDSGTTWFTRGFHLAGTTYTIGSITSNATGNLAVGGATNFRIRCTAYTSGTATVRISGSINPTTFYIANSLQISDPTTPTQKLGIDSSGRPTVNLAAGLALVGKVGIDQTTPGTTNAVATTNLPTTVDTNSGNKSASTLRVVLATDQPALTNKILVTPDSVALPANQSVNVSQINAVTPLMGNGASGTGAQRVTLANDSTGVIDKIVTSMTPGTAASNMGKAEDGAHSSGDTGVFMLAVSNENNTAFAAASGDYIPVATNRYGAVYITSWPPSHASSNGTPITATTTSVVAAPSASNHLRVVRIHMSNGGSTAAWVAVRDGAAGTQYYRTYLPQGGAMSINLRGSGLLDLTSATRLDIVLSAAGSVEYTIDYLTVSD